jgi:pimeloyl-ACP methyl ester carboxylesterase
MSAASLSPTRRELLAATAAAGAVSTLPGTLHAAAGRDAIRPFTVNIPQEEVEELRRRIAATRWPERELVSDAASRRTSATLSAGDTQGVQLATMQKLIQYWGTEYDWSKCEARLKAMPHFMTEIDGLDIHFIHVKSKHQGALPVIITHGWPGSIIEQLKIIDPLTNPTAHGGSASDAFDVVIPSMPGYGFSAKPTEPGWNPVRIAKAWTVLMKRLGYNRFVAQGGDWGALITEQMALLAPPELIAIHSNMPGTIPPEIVKALAAGSPPPSAPTRSAPPSRSRSSTGTVWATPTRWRFVRKRSPGSSIHPLAWRRGFSITMRTATR